MFRMCPLSPTALLHGSFKSLWAVRSHQSAERSVIILEADFDRRDSVLSRQSSAWVFELISMDENVVLGIEFGACIGALNVEQTPFLDPGVSLIGADGARP